MAKTQRTYTSGAMLPASASVIPLPSALSTRVENIRVRGNYPAGIVSLVRVRRHLRAVESRALLAQPPQQKTALSPIEKAEDELIYWSASRDFAHRMLATYRRVLASACSDTGQELNLRLQRVGVLQLVQPGAKGPVV